MTDQRQNTTTETKYLALQDAMLETQPSCSGMDQQLWFPEGNQYRSAETAIAKQICSECPLKILCADYAIEAKEAYGIWGGLTPDQRNRFRF